MEVVREQEVNVSGEVIAEYSVFEPNEKDKAKAKQKAEAKFKARMIRQALTLFALFLCAVLWFFNFKWYIIIIPMILHLALAFYAYAKKFYADRNKVRAWNAYLKRYGDKNGRVPEHTKMIHRKLIAQGKSIKC